MNKTLRGSVAVVGIGQTPFYRRGESPSAGRKLALQAIVEASRDAGIDPKDIDGFSSYADDEHCSTVLMQSLGTKELTWSSMVWSGGGGGLAGAIGSAAAAICTGQARIVVVYRTIVERDQGRFHGAVIRNYLGNHYEPHGIVSPAQICAVKAQRLIHAGVSKEAIRSFVLAEYYHAQRNSRACVFGKPLSPEQYAAGRLICDPFNIYDCSRENDVSCAILLAGASMAADLRTRPVYLLGVAQGGPGQVWENEVNYTSAGFSGVARRLWNDTGYGPEDIDVAQIYESFSAAAVAAIIDHGFCTIETSSEFLTLKNLMAPTGKFPVNTAGGNIAEGNAHGMGLALEAMRQLRGESFNQVPDAKLCLLTGGPTSPLVSSALFGTGETV